MSTKDEWILFLEKNPQFSELAKSALYISILRLLAKSSLNMDKIHSFFPMVENKDLELIIESLVELRLITGVCFGENLVYVLTPEGQKLLNAYERARESFKVE